MPPTNKPDPIKVGRNGALTFYNHAAKPAENPVVIKFYLPIIISKGISINPIYKPHLEKCKAYLLRCLLYPKKCYLNYDH